MPAKPNVRDVARFLSTVKGFKSLVGTDLERLAQNVDTQTLPAGSYLIHKDAEGDSMHVIQSGEVEIQVRDPDGSMKLTVLMTRGAIVGEFALLTGKKRTADVVCLTEVVTCVFRREMFLPVIRANPSLAQFLTEILMERIAEDRSLKKVGNYQLGRQLGRGATSTVYEATHSTLSRQAAAKMLSHSLVYDQAFLERFVQEALIIAELDHPNIVHVYDLEEAHGTRFIIMEMVNGRSLDAVLAERGKFTPDETIHIIGQIAAALSYAHSRGIIHGDIKPANCTLSPDGHLKLLDFGVSHRAGLGKRADLCGTPAYIAPELIRGMEDDGRSDIYSLGAMAFKLVMGRNVFLSDSVDKVLAAHLTETPPDPLRLCPDMPLNLATFIRSSLIKDPDRRLTDWEQILNLLDVTPASAAPATLVSKSYQGKAGTEAVIVSYPASRRNDVTDVLAILTRLGATVLPLRDTERPNAGTPAPEIEDEVDRTRIEVRPGKGAGKEG
ncbi:MAG: protein kinase [Alphaproteobacteria bacterium]|nr:protein kinase [Alphaproteobacteria bacterium]